MLKKILAIIFTATLSLQAGSNQKSYDEAKNEARATNKIVALTVVSSSCPWCHKFLRETLGDKTIIDALNKDFILVVLNKDLSPLPDGIAAKLVPTTHFLDKNGERVSAPAIGFWGSEDFASYLSDALKKHKR